jgi:hypothetical protein
MKLATLASEAMATVVPETERVLAELLQHKRLSILQFLPPGALKQVFVHPFRSCPVLLDALPIKSYISNLQWQDAFT